VNIAVFAANEKIQGGCRRNRCRQAAKRKGCGWHLFRPENRLGSLKWETDRLHPSFYLPVVVDRLPVLKKEV
jgi:hypothetical protein